MRETEGQKNWNRYWEQQPGHEKKFPWKYFFFGIFMLIIVGIGIISTIMPRITTNQEAEQNYEYSASNNLTAGGSIITSNTPVNFNTYKNGKRMAEQIRVIFQYNESVQAFVDASIQNASNSEKNIKSINSYISTIEKMKFHSSYDEFISAILSKYQYAIRVIEDNAQEKSYYTDYLLYAAIDTMSELAKAFDKAKVKYELDGNYIEYHYFDK